MFYLSSKYIDELIGEDLTHFDFTSYLMGIEGNSGTIEFYTRQKCVVSGIEEVQEIFKRLNIEIISTKKTGDILNENEVFIKGKGISESLHIAWKICQNILEYSSGIATSTKNLVEKARLINTNISIGTTRKNFPGTKELAIKSILAGGAIPHRLGLSDSVLIFKQHLAFCGTKEQQKLIINSMKNKAPEKKILIEADNCQEALFYSKLNIDGIQIDKEKPEELKKCIDEIRNNNKNLVILVAGGINESNIEKYAIVGADVLVTSSVYQGKPIDIGNRINKI
ncbi:MAG: ModD protein [Fusobacteriaceae bacterium]|nr:ModD protein [Fusobacteriaceae bacterium]